MKLGTKIIDLKTGKRGHVIGFRRACVIAWIDGRKTYVSRPILPRVFANYRGGLSRVQMIFSVNPTMGPKTA